MIDDRVLELINKEIDGTITPVERTMLDEYRAKSPEVDAIEYELRDLVGDLDRVHHAEPPSTLKSRIFRSIQSERPQPAVPTVAVPVRDFFARFMGMRTAYVFFGGFALGALAIAFIVKVSNVADVSPEDASGALIVGSTTTRLEQGALVPVNAPGVLGVLSTHNADKISVLKVKLNSADRVRARYTFDPASTSVRAFQRGTDAESEMNVQGNILEVQTQGSDGYTIYFDRKTASPTPLRVTLYLADTEIFDKNIQIGKAH